MRVGCGDNRLLRDVRNTLVVQFHQLRCRRCSNRSERFESSAVRYVQGVRCLADVGKCALNVTPNELNIAADFG